MHNLTCRRPRSQFLTSVYLWGVEAYLVLKGFLYNSDLFMLLILPFSVHLAHTRSCQANNGTQKNLFYFKTFLKY